VPAAGFEVDLGAPYLYSVILRVRERKPADAARVLRRAAQAARAHQADRFHDFDRRLFAQKSYLATMMADSYSPGETARLRDPKGRTEVYDWTRLPGEMEAVADLVVSKTRLPLSRQRATARYWKALGALRDQLHRARIDERFDATAQGLYTDVMRAWHDLRRARDGEGQRPLLYWQHPGGIYKWGHPRGALPGAHVRDQAGYTAHNLYASAALARQREGLGNGRVGSPYFVAQDANLRQENVLFFTKGPKRDTRAFKAMEREHHAQFVRLSEMSRRAGAQGMAKVKGRYGRFHF